MRFYLLAFVLILSPKLAVSQTADNPTFSGDASIMTNYVWHGLTLSRRNPAVQASFVYHLAPVFKVGLWGSNVSFYNSSAATALMKINADLMLKFSPNFMFNIKYSDNKYFETDNRDGNTLVFDFIAFDKHNFGFEQESNWLGGGKARYIYYGHISDVLGDAKWENKFGYTQFEGVSATNYIDIRSSLGTKRGFVFWAITGTLLTSKEQFGDYADYFIILSGTAKF